MKPVNFDSQPCNPISSNCVVWQGPNIPCIALCTGDTVSDVVAALATELCTVLDTLNVNNYDLSCFNITNCKPKDFIALIDFLTQQICELQNITPTEKSKSGCPDCMLSVPECLNAPQPVMNLAEYVNFLATKICGIIGDVADVNTEINQLKTRVTNIENNCCDDTPPPPLMVNVDCAIPTVGEFEITQALEAFLNDFFCTFYQYTTGTVTQLESAISSQCIANTDPTKSNPSTVYGNLSGWVNSPGTIADTLKNIWLVICDLYDQNISTYDVQAANTPTIITNVTTSGANPTVFTVSSKINDTGWQPLNGFDFLNDFPVGDRPRVRRIGNVLHFAGTAVVPMGTTDNGASGTAEQENSTLSAYEGLKRGMTLNSALTSDTDACQIYCAMASGAPQPYTGSGQSQYGSWLYFNRGNGVLPAGILNAGETLDKYYKHNGASYQVLDRAVQINNISRTATMNTLVRIDIQASGSNAKLRMTAATARESYRATTGIVYASGLRSMISRAVTGSPVPYIDGTTPGFQTGLVNSINLAGTITSSASTTTITGIASTSALHPGMLLVKKSGTGTFLGAVVTIDSVDSETQISITTTDTSGVPQNNVSGALEFYVRNEYLMTGNTTMYQRDGLGNLYTGTNVVAAWGHDQDAGDALQLGGFVFALDGLTAFVSPCGTSVVDYAACT